MHEREMALQFHRNINHRKGKQMLHTTGLFEVRFSLSGVINAPRFNLFPCRKKGHFAKMQVKETPIHSNQQRSIHEFVHRSSVL